METGVRSCKGLGVHGRICFMGQLEGWEQGSNAIVALLLTVTKNGSLLSIGDRRVELGKPFCLFCVCNFFFQMRLCYVIAQDGLKLVIFLPQPPKCWNYRQVTLSLDFKILKSSFMHYLFFSCSKNSFLMFMVRQRNTNMSSNFPKVSQPMRLRSGTHHNFYMLQPRRQAS